MNPCFFTRVKNWFYSLYFIKQPVAVLQVDMIFSKLIDFNLKLKNA